ncbi:MAG TPA: polysaccharide deacetylase family protein [Candidatus Angelobacter sp.]|jgi:peptidoglycan-N-acetylglucosamine deacetylase|nr:polysaccharide deacetylase family protein [Candidatus Angelobacter sp.]
MLLPITLVAAAAAGYAGYSSMAPESQLYGRTLTHGSDPGQMVLTYDDGPNDPHTQKLLDLLAEHQAKATFFLIGRYVRQRPDLVRAIRSAGHVIGNHTETHPNLIFTSAGQVTKELESCSKALQDVTGEETRWFRPPFGGRRPEVLRIARRLGLEPVMWSVTGYDWNAQSNAAIVNKVVRQVEGRRRKRAEIILLHDGGHRSFGADRHFTIEATRELLKKYSAEKKFVSVAELVSA